MIGIIKALAKLNKSIPHHLVLVGGSGWDMHEVATEINNQGISHRIHLTGYVSDEQLSALYQMASLYIHPSLYEGFGLTILEAMAAGCPVITSDSYSLPEVAGDAALLVDPYNVDDIAEAILSLWQDQSLKTNLVNRGLARAKQFTWDQCASRVAEIYQSVV